MYVTDNEYKGTERKEKPFIFDQIFDKKDSNSQAFFFFLNKLKLTNKKKKKGVLIRNCSSFRKFALRL